MKVHMHDIRFLVSLLVILPAWATVWLFHESQPHMVLATNLLMLVVGYWLGSSKGSSDKDKLVAEMQPKQCCKEEEGGHTGVD